MMMMMTIMTNIMMVMIMKMIIIRRMIRIMKILRMIMMIIKLLLLLLLLLMIMITTKHTKQANKPQIVFVLPFLYLSFVHPYFEKQHWKLYTFLNFVSFSSQNGIVALRNAHMCSARISEAYPRGSWKHS